MKWNKKTILSFGEDVGLYIIHDFLSAAECSILIRMANKKGLRKGGFRTMGDRSQNSFITTFPHDASSTLLKLNERMVDFTGIPLDQGEDLKIIHYKKGGYVGEHNDYLTKPNKHIKGGCRIAQMLFYLNDVEEGGETGFPNIGIEVLPKKGSALLWYGIEGMSPFAKLDDKGKLIVPKIFRTNPFARHYSKEIKKGEKWIAAKILHNIPFDKPTSYYA